jgi:hypothetical protein
LIWRLGRSAEIMAELEARGGLGLEIRCRVTDLECQTESPPKGPYAAGKRFAEARDRGAEMALEPVSHAQQRPHVRQATQQYYAEVRDGIPEGPRRLLREYLDRGWLGQKTGCGFYDYEETR